MQIFPAIDLSGGQVVRLYQGDYDQMTRLWSGPLLPLPGSSLMPAAFTWWTWTVPETVLWQTLRVSPPLPARGGLFIEVGGGIRTEDRIREYLDLGVSRCHPRHRGRQGLCLHCSDGGKVR